MVCPKAALFDLDETLAPTLQPPTPEMSRRIAALLELVPVAILTGRYFDEIQPELLTALSGPGSAGRSFILSSGASKGYTPKDGRWEELYSFELTPEEIVMIRGTVEATAAETGALEGLPTYGERFFDKGTMLSLAMLGERAPAELRRSWDPGNKRRHALQAALQERLPEYDVLMGGLSSIDISRKGINKAYGVRWVSKRLQIEPGVMLYVGDALFEGGNDAVVLETGVPVRPTSGPDETAGIIDDIIKSCSVSDS